VTANPHGYEFTVCLTHDIDFVGIRNHLCDHSMFGFILRGTIGALNRFARGRLSLSRLLRCWAAVMSLPLVFLRVMRDFWEPFEWYLEVEKGLPATYFIIPFKGHAGVRLPAKHASRRAAAYDVRDIQTSIRALLNNGCEVGVHGLDAWHDSEKGREELQRIAEVANARVTGIRMHWLLQDANTPRVLEKGGFTYDSTCGYNNNVGYRAGTTQVFRPFGLTKLLELPLHIQDGALFYPQQLNLSDNEAKVRCAAIIRHAERVGGVVTVLWHDRSHGPERFWGEFYKELVTDLKRRKAWFASAQQAVDWFGCRRAATFDSDSNTVRHKIQPLLNVRVYKGSRDGASSILADVPWDGDAVKLDRTLNDMAIDIAAFAARHEGASAKFRT